MSKNQRRTPAGSVKIKLLREARKILETTPVKYTHLGVCSAITDARYKLLPGRADGIPAILDLNNNAEYLRIWIRRMLNGHSFLNGWLRNRGYPADTDYAMLRATRLAWIDWMIAELKRTGETE